MKTNYFLIATALFLAATLCISTAWCETPGEGDQRVSYEKYIDERIQHNEFQANLGSATAPNLRENAQVAREKAEFLKINRDALINNMEVDLVERKPYKMSRYLNRTFYDSYRAEGPLMGEAAIEAYEEPE